RKKVGTLPAIVSRAPGEASATRGARLDWNRAGHAQTGEAKGPDVGGHPAPFFFCIGPAMAWLGADTRRERNRGDPEVSRRASTLACPHCVVFGRRRSHGASLRRQTARRKSLKARCCDGGHCLANAGTAPGAREPA